MQVTANGLTIEVEDTGADGSQALRPAVLLVMGLGMQLVAWPAVFVQALQAAGFRVIRFDNRDVGLSSHFDHLGVPNMAWQMVKYRIGLPVRPPYSLHDMALDAVCVLDALGVVRAHVVGMSMGGMIAQRVALAAPERVLSLTSIMSSSGARGLPGPSQQVLRVLLGKPREPSEAAVVDHYVKFFKLIGSPGYPMDEAVLRENVLLSTRRSFHPAGVQRQMLAAVADVRRARELAQLRLPTLVLHGQHDPLVPYACGQDTARRIAGAQLVGIGGMGHDLAPGVIERLLPPLLPHLQARSA